VLMVEEGKVNVILQRETVDDLLNNNLSLRGLMVE